MYFILVNCMGWQVWQCQITALKIRKIIKLVGYILCWVSKLYQFVSHGSSLHTFAWNLKRLDMVWLIHAIAQATKHAQHEQQAYVQMVPAVIIECVKCHWYRLTFVTIRAWKSRQILMPEDTLQVLWALWCLCFKMVLNICISDQKEDTSDLYDVSIMLK